MKIKFKTFAAGRLALALVIPAAAIPLAACGGTADSSGNAATAETQNETTQENTTGATATETTQNKSEKFHLKIAYSPSVCQAPLHVAVENGFFEEEGIDAENIQVEAAHVAEAIGADQVDVGFGLIGKFLQPIENGLNIKFTAGIHTGCVKVLAKADSGINSVSDLKGKKIGVTGLAGAETLIAKRALAEEGVNIDEANSEVEFVVFSGSDLGQALENGAVDAIGCPDPNASQFADQYGLTTIIDTAQSDQFKDEYCCGAFVTEKLATEHPEVAAAFTRAVLKAAVWVNENPEEAAKIQIDNNYVTGDAGFNAELLKSYNYIPSVQGGYDAIELSVQQLTDIGILKEGTDSKDFADKAYLFFDSSEVPDTYSASEVIAGSKSYSHSQSATKAVVNKTTAEEEDCCEDDKNEHEKDCCEKDEIETTPVIYDCCEEKKE